MDDLKYPIGSYQAPETYSREVVEQRINEIKAFPFLLVDAVNPLNGKQIDTPYRSEGWTVRQLVHHIGDSHMQSYIRMKWALTEQDTTIKPYDQEAWAGLPDSKAPVSVSLELIMSLHKRWGYLLDSLSEEEYRITYRHPETGEQTLWKHIDHYAWHGRHHLAHITSLIERENWQ